MILQYINDEISCIIILDNLLLANIKTDLIIYEDVVIKKKATVIGKNNSFTEVIDKLSNIGLT